MYLTDEAYKTLLVKIREVVSAEGFTVERNNCDDIGAKDTSTNCGLCNDNFTTKETAMWPELFPKRNDMAYPRTHHHCPFDTRRPLGHNDVDGCFYTCLMFAKSGKARKNIPFLLQCIDEVTKWANSDKFEAAAKKANEE